MDGSVNGPEIFYSSSGLPFWQPKSELTPRWQIARQMLSQMRTDPSVGSASGRDSRWQNRYHVSLPNRAIHVIMTNLIYYLDRPGGQFSPTQEAIPSLRPGEVLLRTAKTSVCQSDVVIYRQGLPRIKQWPAIVLHEVCSVVEAVGDGVTKFAPGDLVGIGCDIPCGNDACIYCGKEGTGDWTSCPNTQATGHEFPDLRDPMRCFPLGLCSTDQSLNSLRGLTLIMLVSSNP